MGSSTGRLLALAGLMTLAMLVAACAGAQPTPTAAPAKPTGAPAVASPAATASPAPAAASPAPAAGNTATVRMQETMFEPDRITVPVGTTVVWDNTDNSTHTVTADRGEFDSGTSPADWMGPGKKFSFTFRAPGTYPYHCIPHQQLGMTGTVVVQ